MDSKFQNSQKGATTPDTHYRAIQQSVQEVKQELNKLVITKEELIALRQENGRLRGRLHEVQEASTEFYELIERTLNLPGIHEEYRKATEILLSNFNKYLSAALGVETIIPSPGDPFQDKRHQAVGYEPLSSANVSVEFVQNCVSWGYTIKNWGDPTVLETVKPAEVNVTTLTETYIDLSPTEGLLEDQIPTDSQIELDKTLRTEIDRAPVNEAVTNETATKVETLSQKDDPSQAETDATSSNSITEVAKQAEISSAESVPAPTDDISTSEKIQ